MLSTQHLAAQLAQSARNEVNVFIKPQLSHAGIAPPPYHCRVCGYCVSLIRYNGDNDSDKDTDLLLLYLLAVSFLLCK